MDIFDTHYVYIIHFYTIAAKLMWWSGLTIVMIKSSYIS